MMIPIIFLGFGVVAGFLLFMGWWIIPPVYTLLAGTGLGFLWIVQHRFHYRWKAVTCAATFVYFNLACAAWFDRFWEEHHYPIAPLRIAQFVLILVGVVFLCLLLAYVRASFTDPPHPAQRDDTDIFKRIFPRKHQKKQEPKHVSIVLGESVKKDVLHEK